MARRVYFAFHFERDIFRANVVRNSNVVRGAEAAGFFDKSEYDEVKRQTPEAIARHLRERMKGTSVTAVLIGRETALRPWVRWEIEQSLANKNGLIGVYIHHLNSVNERGDPPQMTPPVPSVPWLVTFPLIYWNPQDLGEWAAQVEAAGQRADAARASERLAFQAALAAKLRQR